MCHLSSRVDGAGDQNVLFGSQMCSLPGFCPLLSEGKWGGACTHPGACGPVVAWVACTAEGAALSVYFRLGPVWILGQLQLSTGKSAQLSPFQ